MDFFKSLTPEFQCILFLLHPVPELNLAVKIVFPLVVENIILPAQGSSDTSSLKTIQDLVLPFVCVRLGTRCGVGRLSCHPVTGEGTSVSQSVLSPCWPTHTHFHGSSLVSVCASVLASGPKDHANFTFLTPSTEPWGPSPLRTLQPLWGSGTLGWKWIHFGFLGPASYII